MGIMNDIKGDGHSLVAPRLTVGWGVYAIVAIMLLVFFVGIGMMVYKGTIGKVTGTSGKSLTDLTQSSGGATGTGTGWY